MPNLASAYASPGTTITTTTETLAANVPAGPLALPGGSPQVVAVRCTVWVTTGTGVTALAIKLRVGQSNTTTNQVGQSAQEVVIASALQAVQITFYDTTPGKYSGSGYSITVSQIGATGNGTVTAVGYEVAVTP